MKPCNSLTEELEAGGWRSTISMDRADIFPAQRGRWTNKANRVFRIRSQATGYGTKAVLGWAEKSPTFERLLTKYHF